MLNPSDCLPPCEIQLSADESADVDSVFCSTTCFCAGSDDMYKSDGRIAESDGVDIHELEALPLQRESPTLDSESLMLL